MLVEILFGITREIRKRVRLLHPAALSLQAGRSVPVAQRSGRRSVVEIEPIIH